MNATPSGGALALAAMVGWTASLGCAQVIGLQDAHEDPSYTPQAQGGSAGSPDPAEAGSAATRASSGGHSAQSAGAAGAQSAVDDPVGSSGGAGGSAGAPTQAAGAAGGAGGGPAGYEPPCYEYCETVMANCEAPYAVYTSLETCLAVCEALPTGSPGAEIGNSVACRLRNAQLARTTGEPDVHCPIAGPGGFGVCGSNCEGYCVVTRQVCSAGFAAQFESLVDCNRQCEGLEESGAFDVSQKSGNTVGCRLWHVSAASLDPGTHCPHTLGAPPCAP